MEGLIGILLILKSEDKDLFENYTEFSFLYLASSKSLFFNKINRQ